jgi:hypothetical protein
VKFDRDEQDWSQEDSCRHHRRNPDRGWAAQAHIPALRSLSDDFEIAALSTSRRESADAAGERFGVPAAFDNHQELVTARPWTSSP